MPQIPVYDGPQVKVRALQPVMQRTPDVSSGLQSLARPVEQQRIAVPQVHRAQL